MELPKTARPVKNTIDTWADVDGSLYTMKYRGPVPKGGNRKGRLIKINQHQSKTNGYMYAGLKFIDGYKTIRVHRIIAETFIKNPTQFPLVGHQDNNKTNNTVENLYWTDSSENTLKAYVDGLAKNDVGYEDSQSMPVIMFDGKTHEEIQRFGSICIAAKETGFSKSTIARQAKYMKPNRKPWYFRYNTDHTQL